MRWIRLEVHAVAVAKVLPCRASTNAVHTSGTAFAQFATSPTMAVVGFEINALVATSRPAAWTGTHAV